MIMGRPRQPARADHRGHVRSKPSRRGRPASATGIAMWESAPSQQMQREMIRSNGLAAVGDALLRSRNPAQANHQGLIFEIQPAIELACHHLLTDRAAEADGLSIILNGKDNPAAFQARGGYLGDDWIRPDATRLLHEHS